MKMVYLCADLEHPYTNLAHVHTDQDEEHLMIKGLENGPHWIGGSRLGRRKEWVWYTYKDMTRRNVSPVRKFYWAPGEPRSGVDCRMVFKGIARTLSIQVPVRNMVPNDKQLKKL